VSAVVGVSGSSDSALLAAAYKGTPMRSPRITPAEPPYAEDVAEELARWMPPNTPLEPLKLFRTLVRRNELARAMWPLGSYLLSRRFSIGLRERELVIQRVCARCACEYEWGVHASIFAARAGFSEDELDGTYSHSGNDPRWDEAHSLLVRMVDQLHDTGGIDDDLWSSLSAKWTEEQLLDLLVLAGWYHVISYVANGARVEREDWARAFPEGGSPSNKGGDARSKTSSKKI